MLVRIDDASDPALAAYTAIRERDLVGRDGAFIAEGEVVVRVLAGQRRLRVRSLLLEERRVAPLRDVVDGLDDVPTYVVSQAVMDTVVGFSIHRGVLALGERPAPVDPVALARHPLVVALVGLTNHDNVGGIFRNAAAFGAHVLLDAHTCDPLYRKAIRVSAGAALTVPFARTADVVDTLVAAGHTPLALTPGGTETLEALTGERFALLLGTEGPGLPDAILARSRRVRIDMVPGFDSLNVAVASGIALQHAYARSRHGA